MKLKAKVTPNQAAIATFLIASVVTPVAMTAACLQLGDRLENRSGSVRGLFANPWNIVFLSSVGLSSAFASQSAATKAGREVEKVRREDSRDA